MYRKTVLMVWFVIASPAIAEDQRKWTSQDGRFSINASFVAKDGKFVSLKTTDGRDIRVPIGALSSADQQYLASQDVASSGSDAMDEALQKELENTGLRASGDDLILLDQSKLNRGLTETAQLQKKLFLASRTLTNLQIQRSRLDQAMNQLRLQNVQLNSQLASVTTVSANNRLIGLINANESKIQLLAKQSEGFDQRITESRRDVNSEREAFVDYVLELRKIANELSDRWDALSRESSAIALLEKLNAATGKAYQLNESRSLLTAEKRLLKIEDTVLSESIPLRREPNGSLYVSAVVDGKSNEMVLDSGASITSLPAALAAQLGVKPSSNDPDIILQLADGRPISAKLVSLSNVRVGKFTVENVRAAVLGPEATAAEPLLGMSFLDNFKFEIDAQQGTLTMVKVKTD